MEVMIAIGGPAHFPRPPFARARLTVVRHGRKQCDFDGLAASVKHLADVLQVASKRNPQGLGIMLGDDPEACEMHIHQQPAVGAAETVVRVEELA